MTEIEYVGASHVRTISKKDWKDSAGIENDAISIDTRVCRVAEVSDEAAEWLLRNEKGDWKVSTPQVEQFYSQENEEPVPARAGKPKR